MNARDPRWALCLEQTLGHRAHSRNLEEVSRSVGVPLDLIHVDYPEAPKLRIPWTVRGSYLARKALQSRGRKYSVVFYHTQSVALFAPQTAAAARYVVSVDATPKQMDEMGEWYAHKRSLALAESGKAAWYRRVFAGATALVAWSDWAAESLSRDYGVPEAKITVAHPGAPSAFFDIPRGRPGGLPQVLFVGGDFERKGGPSLLRAFEPLAGRARLTVVSNDVIPAVAGLNVERGVTPGSDRLYSAYASSDIFCFPTRGDCTPLVLGEAMAAGLPVITTNVGSNRETLQGGAGGVLITPGSDDELAVALERLVTNAEERQRMGEAARRIARDRLDAMKNGARIMELLAKVAS